MYNYTYPFLATKPEKINFVTAQPRESRSTAQIKTVLDMVLDKYDTRGFNVTIIHGDNEFKIAQLKEYLLPVLVEIYGKDKKWKSLK